MSNDRCGFAMLAGLGSFLVLAPACGQSGQAHGAADAPLAKGDAGTADAPIFTGNDAGPDAAVTGTGTGTDTGTGTGTGDAGHSDGGRSSDANTSVDGSTDAGLRTDAGVRTDAAGARTDVAGVTPDASHIPPPDTFNMGMNVPSLNYYNNVAIYADMALAIAGNDGPWDNANGSGAAPLDVNGNPTVAASTSVTASYPSGDYAFSWDGTGSLKVTGASLGKVTVTTNNGVQHNAATMTWTLQTVRSSGATTQSRACGGCMEISTTTGRSTRRTSPRSMQTSPARSVRHRDLKSNALTMETCAAGWKACGHERISTPARIG